MVWSKNSGTKMKNLMSRIISGLDVAGERISELEDISIETSKTENLREQGLEKQNRICKDCGTTIKVAICLMGNQKEERKEQ